ncbi:MAG: rRNA methyltransferase [Chloroflexi bacterium AL-W]|nr:rRNA methyltransferase [Chloroflexi bacterium AL-N1]NOK68773.1 rRNA methyltransferase [Chloroflexi bacterium AL-N10]NOK76259.1 rRNA methyltransferase [Chloroflexi bacterium AL-N5]NOK84104.1 rRNA methyltransferase [Chloroflexi bacterium AL-W]NOK91397.1 rRNA methyltransferase [Chloroflexi bacterium AL-N15]
MNDSASLNLLNRFVVVLDHPQDIRNIGGVIRAMKNMGFQHLRLIAPPALKPNDLRGIAHRSDDIITTMEIHTNLADALHDMTYVVGTTGRQRQEHTVQHYTPDITTHLLQQAQMGQVALLFGSEGNGLDNSAMDYCHTIVTLPTNPEYASLNLAQAVLLLMYELRRLSIPVLSTEGSIEAPASVGQLTTLYTAIEQALDSIAFFKSGNPTPTMRTVRAVLQRAHLTMRETSLLTAMSREVVAFLKHKGLSNHDPPDTNT